MSLHPVDVHVGLKLKSKRVILGISQEELGKAVGVTFQQIQKYERGLNRISSSRLYEFSCILGANISYFFEDINNSVYQNSSNNPGYEDSVLSSSSSLNEEDGIFEYEKLGNNKEVLYLVRYYYAIEDIDIRKKVFSLIKSLSANKLSSAKASKGTKDRGFEKVASL